MNESHPYNDYSSIPKRTRLLIVGTAPPPRFSTRGPEDLNSEDVDFYYGSKDNLLWSQIFPELYPGSFPISDADKRRLFLKSQNFWMHDICEKYTRNGSGTGALDKDLVVLERADLRRILEEHKTINSIVFTGKKAEELSGKQMEFQKLIRPYKFWAEGISKATMPRPRLLSVAFNEDERKIQTFTVPSPSPNTLRAYDLSEIVDLYRTALCSRL
jgi:G:T/U-mismatch repair DNA glycosylase